MKLYHRYIFKEVLISCVSSIGLFVMILLAGNVVKDVLKLLAAGQMGFGFFVRTILTLIPSVVAYALPLGMLTGILIAVGRMSSQNEILILRASGINLWNIAKPVFFLGFCGVLLSLAVNLFYAPRALVSYRMGLKNAIRENPLSFIRPQQFVKNFSGYILYADQQNQDRLEHFRIWEFNPDGEMTLFLSAKSGSFHYNETLDCLELALNEGSIEHRTQQSEHSEPTIFFQNFSINLPLDRIFGKRDAFQKRYKHMDIIELIKTRKSFQDKIYQLQTGEATQLIHQQTQEYRHQIIQIQFMIQQNIALAFSILTLSLVAIPLALKTQRKETSANVVLAMALALSYYFSTVMISWLQDYVNLRPDILLWIPNATLLILGSWLFWRASRH